MILWRKKAVRISSEKRLQTLSTSRNVRPMLGPQEFDLDTSYLFCIFNQPVPRPPKAVIERWRHQAQHWESFVKETTKLNDNIVSDFSFMDAATAGVSFHERDRMGCSFAVGKLGSIGRYCECLVADPKRPVLRNPPIVPDPCHV